MIAPSQTVKVLIINAGSSSFKYQLFSMGAEHSLCSGLVERIGDVTGRLVHKVAPGSPAERVYTEEKHFSHHSDGMHEMVALLTSPEWGVLADVSELYALGHRVLMGGPDLCEVQVDQHVKDVIRSYIPLGPLHNPANLACIEDAESLFPSIPQVAVFDTGFHSTMPDYAYTYAIPRQLAEKYRLRRYGFHGTSHHFVTREAARLLELNYQATNYISCHLGNGCSITAVQNGQCIDTSMGLTPLEGLVMGTRSGDLDPALITYLMQQENLSPEQANTLLNKESGLKGVGGHGDMRDLMQARAQGDPHASLAYNMFVYRLRKYIGSYTAILGHVNALIFTGGIGENDPETRSLVCQNLFAYSLDPALNLPRVHKPRPVHRPATPPVLVIPTNEELEIARATLRVLATNLT